MFITKPVQDAINEQIKDELYSAYLYLAMSAHFEVEGFTGFAVWTRGQAEEEVEHAMKLFDYVNERGGRVALQAIDQPPLEWGTPLEIFESILEHEQKVTSLINDLVYLAREQKDNPSEIFLQWYVNEQVEEENNVKTVLGQLKLIKDSSQALFIMDKDMAQRLFTPPVPESMKCKIRKEK